MSVEKVKKFFKQYGLEDQVLEFDVSSATVELAAAALGCEPGRIAKTLAFKIGEQPILVVAAGDVKIDNPKYKACFGKKAKMLKPGEAEQLIGYSVGGICPFAVNQGVEIYLDESLKKYQTVFPACGSSNSAIELTPDEIAQYSGSTTWVDVCKS